jgi:hypothetical protein
MTRKFKEPMDKKLALKLAKEHYQECVEKCDGTDLSIAQYCKSKGIPAEAMYNYRHSLRKPKTSGSKATNPEKAETLVKARKEGEGVHTKKGVFIAPDFLTKAVGHLQDRAVTYDKPEGERSMAKTVEMFNALTDSAITEEQGWKFMALLKLVRSEQGNFKADNFEDGAAYMALAGETASKNQKITYQEGKMPS